MHVHSASPSTTRAFFRRFFVTCKSFLGLSKHLDWNFHFGFGCEPIYHRLPPLAIFFASIPRPKGRACPAAPLPKPESHDLPHFEAISRTHLPQHPPSSRLISPAKPNRSVVRARRSATYRIWRWQRTMISTGARCQSRSPRRERPHRPPAKSTTSAIRASSTCS